MLTSVITVGIVGAVVLVSIFTLSYCFATLPLIRCVAESILTGIVLLLLVVNIVLGAEDVCNYYTLGGVTFLSSIYLITDWRDYKYLKSWFWNVNDEKNDD